MDARTDGRSDARTDGARRPRPRRGDPACASARCSARASTQDVCARRSGVASAQDRDPAAARRVGLASAPRGDPPSARCSACTGPAAADRGRACRPPGSRPRHHGEAGGSAGTAGGRESTRTASRVTRRTASCVGVPPHVPGARHRHGPATASSDHSAIRAARHVLCGDRLGHTVTFRGERSPAPSLRCACHHQEAPDAGSQPKA